VTRIARYLESSAAADRERQGGLTGGGFVAGFTLGTIPSQAAKAPLPRATSTASSSGDGSKTSDGNGVGGDADLSPANVASAVEVK
jgi:hypothetical protein